MNEILKKLLESELLSEESKQELTEAFDKHLSDVVEEARTNAIAEAKVELHEQYAQQKDALIDAIDSKVNEYMLSEFAALKEDIKAFRDLEAEKAVELAKEKKALGKTLKEDMAKLVRKLDKFLEVRIAEEFNDIKEDIKEAKKLEFGRKVFEAFAPEYRKFFVDPTNTEKELTEAKIKIDKLSKKYKNMKKDKDDLYRKVRIESILSPLSGNSRDVMESILSSIATEKLEEAYKLYLPRVLKEQSSDSTKPAAKLNETVSYHHFDEPIDMSGLVVTGDVRVPNQITESADESSSFISEFTRLAGITTS